MRHLSFSGAWLVWVGLVAALAACGTGSTPTPTQEVGAGPSGEVREIKVTADNLRFSPSSITVQKGERVRFTVTSKDIFHTFTFVVNGQEINLNLQRGDTRSTKVITFDTAQEIAFWCKPHRARGMLGYTPGRGVRGVPT